MTARLDALFSYRITDKDRYQSYLEKVLPVTEAQEPYVLSYEIFEGDDGTYYQHEVYENSEALIKHVTVTASGQEDFGASTELISVTMLGTLSQEVRTRYSIPTQYTLFRAVER